MNRLPSRRLLYALALQFALTVSPGKVAAQEKKVSISATPLVFEENKGQAPMGYQFLARRNGTETFYFLDGMDVFVPQKQSKMARLRIRWTGERNKTSLAGEDRLAGYSNYFRGTDESRWLRKVSQFGQIRYENIYPGVDLLFHGSSAQLENDFRVMPDANPSEICLQFDRPLQVTASGDLEVAVGKAVVRLQRPVAYQEFEGVRKEVRAKYVLAGGRRVKFQISQYDHSRALVIDPVFGFSTYLDGSNADSITAVTTDSTGNVYMTGYSGSTDFPITNAGNPLCSVCSDVNQTNETFISKLDPTGQKLLYSSFLGGSNGALGYSIALDKNGNIYVAGVSSSSDFPHVGAVLPLTPAFLNSNYYFVASIRPDGTALNYSGLVGGEEGFYTDGQSGKMAVDSNGNAYLAGTTYDPNFQLTPGTFDSTPTSYANDTMFVLKLDPTGKLVYSTLVPGNVPRAAGTAYEDNFVTEGIVVDANGQVTAAGLGGLGLPTTPGALLAAIPQTTNAIDPTAGFLLQLNASASALNFATYLPGTDGAASMAVDANGNFYVAGSTSETNLPVGPNSYQKNIVPSSTCTCDAGYIIKIDPLAKSVLAATYLSGSGGADYRGTAVDSHSNVMVGGFAFSPDFPLKNPFVATYQTSQVADALALAELDTNLSTLLFGSFLSGTSQSGFEGASFSALTIDGSDNAIVVGTTLANDFPTTPNSFQPSPPPQKNPLVGYQHTFISKLDLATPAPSVCLSPVPINFGGVLVNTPGTQTLTVTNCGNAPLQISAVTSSLPVVTAAESCGAIAPGGTCGVQLTFTPIDTSVSSGTITLTDNAAIAQQVVSFSGVGGLPQVLFPPALPVGDLLVGTQAEFFLGLINQGNGNWIVNSITATGDFTLDTSNCKSPIPPLTGTRGPQAFCSIGILFAPAQPGQRTGTLTITDNVVGSPHVIPLTGNGLTIYPTPSISGILAVPTDAQLPQLRILGTNFFPGSQVSVNGATRTTTYADEQFIVAELMPADVAQPGELIVTVSNPKPGGGTSNSFVATIYSAIRNIAVQHAVFEPISGLIYGSVSAQSASYANQVVVIDPSVPAVTKSFSVGNGPNQLAVSDDGQFLYVGLDGDKRVAQVSIPTGTVNFAVGLGNDLLSQNPMVADAIRVLPGQPHAWVVTLCLAQGEPCGQGIAVFDDAVERTNAVSQNQLEPDSLLFIGQNATTLYGTTFNVAPSTFYEFTINSSGITLSQSVTNFSSASPGGGPLDTDGTSIYVNNGQVINPNTLTISGTISGIPYEPGIRVDAAASRVYFAGQSQFSQLPPVGSYTVEAFDLATQQLRGSIGMAEPPASGASTDIFRWGTKGLAINHPNTLLLLNTSLTSNATPPSQFYVSGLSPATVAAGSTDLSLTISGGGFGAGDALAVDGDPVNVTAVNASQLMATIPAAFLSVPGDVQLAVSDTAGHVANLVLVVTPATTGVSLSTNLLTFPIQVVNSPSTAQTVTISNIGTATLQISSIAVGGDFSQTNSCTTIAAGKSCPIMVVFKPTALGSRTGFLTISDSDISKTQSVALNGTGGDIQIGGVGNSGTSATVPAGQTATYNLSVEPVGGVTAMATFSCTNLPENASCNITPPNADLSKGVANVMVMISTSTQQTAKLRQNSGRLLAALVWPFLAIVLPLAGLGIGADRSKREWPVLLLVLVIVYLSVIGCGGGSSITAPPPNPTLTPQGSYTVNFVATSSQGTKSIPLTLAVN